MNIAPFNPTFLADASVIRFDLTTESASGSWRGRVEVLAVMVTPGGWFSKGTVEFLVADVETGRLIWVQQDEIKKVPSRCVS